MEGNDLEVGKDFFLAFSPERVDPAARLDHLQHPR
jgi:UDP-N-acetyl-D-mannosaminuronate dehydrogenase